MLTTSEILENSAKIWRSSLEFSRENLHSLTEKNSSQNTMDWMRKRKVIKILQKEAKKAATQGLMFARHSFEEKSLDSVVDLHQLKDSIMYHFPECGININRLYYGDKPSRYTITVEILWD